MPMKNISTSQNGSAPVISREGRITPSPRTATIAFLRQFARAYRPAPSQSMPGYVLN